MELQELQGNAIEDRADLGTIGIDEKSDDSNKRGHSQGNLARLIQRYETRASRIEHQPDSVGAKPNRSERVLSAGDAANLDASAMQS
jgi:hypothetical protein